MNRRDRVENAPAAARTKPRRPLAVRVRAMAGFAMACRRAGWAGLPVALAALMAVPMPGAPQVMGACDGNCPVFSPSTALSFRISEGTGTGDAIAVLPAATDEDQDDYQIVYTLWDRDDPIENGNRDEAGFGDGDAAAFVLDEDIDGENGEVIKKLTLKTRVGHDYDYESEPPKRVYRFRLVACDDEFNRAYIDITVHIDNVNEQLGRPDAPTVVGVSTPKLAVRWTPPSNTGPPITDYDVQYRKNGTTDAWRSWSHSGAQTNTVITGLEAGTEYEVQVLARNREGVSAWSPSGTGSTLTAGNNPPVFLDDPTDNPSTTRSFPENTPPGHAVGRPVRAEGESTLTYSLGGTDAGSFDIMSSSGQIRTKPGVTYDFEAKPSYRVTVTATDQNPDSSDATITVAISLDDVDEPPLRPAAPVVATSSGSNTILDVTWSAPDSTGRPAVEDYDLQYRRIAGAGQNCRSWCAHDHTGSSTETAITGLDSGTRYEVQVLARNHEGDSPWSPSGTGWTNVPGNDTPEFTSTPSLSFDESVGDERTPVMDVGQPVTAEDDDVTTPDENGEYDTLTYSLEGPDAGLFTIDSSTGQIKTKSRVYDHEDKPSHSVSVKATDSHQISGTIALTISVNDVNEPPLAPPRPTVRGHSTRSLSVSWRPPANNTGRPEIEDYDLQYRECPSDTCPSEADTGWTNGPQGEAGTSAVIQNATPALSPGALYQVRVRATNDEGDGAWSPPGSGRTLAPPTFPAGPLTRSFRETIGAGEPASRNVGSPVRASFFPGGDLTYTLGATDGGAFDIDAATGQIKTKMGQTYDYEMQGPEYSYSVTVTATDASATSAMVEVTITITDAAERPLAPGTPVVTGATMDSLTVEWEPPENGGRPDIDHYDVQYRKGTSGSWRNGPQDVSGTSTTIANLDSETLYQVQVRAHNSDGYGPYSQPGAGWTRDGTVPTNCAVGSPQTFDLPENTPAGRNIGAVTVTGDRVTYSLHDPDAAFFSINYQTGQLRTRSGVAYDYETRKSYTVTVRGTDSSNACTNVVVTIRITDVENESGRGPGTTTGTRSPSDEEEDEGKTSAGAEDPAFEASSTERSFPENTPPGESVGAPVTATAAAGPLTYTLAGTDAASFDIESGNGQIKTKAGVTYDYETRDTYAVTVKATGPSGASATIAVTINVLDVGEKPAFASAAGVRSFPENTPPGQAIGAPVTAVDPDGDKLTYTLAGTDAASFDNRIRERTDQDQGRRDLRFMRPGYPIR